MPSSCRADGPIQEAIGFVFDTGHANRQRRFGKRPTVIRKWLLRRVLNCFAVAGCLPLAGCTVISVTSGHLSDHDSTTCNHCEPATDAYGLDHQHSSRGSAHVADANYEQREPMLGPVAIDQRFAAWQANSVWPPSEFSPLNAANEDCAPLAGWTPDAAWQGNEAWQPHPCRPHFLKRLPQIMPPLLIQWKAACQVPDAPPFPRFHPLPVRPMFQPQSPSNLSAGGWPVPEEELSAGQFRLQTVDAPCYGTIR